eukprot:COSAG01_NODE_23036_length_830_cov_76.867305_1_plen_62_part_10
MVLKSALDSVDTPLSIAVRRAPQPAGAARKTEHGAAGECGATWRQRCYAGSPFRRAEPRRAG